MGKRTLKLKNIYIEKPYWTLHGSNGEKLYCFNKKQIENRAYYEDYYRDRRLMEIQARRLTELQAENKILRDSVVNISILLGFDVLNEEKRNTLSDYLKSMIIQIGKLKYGGK